MHPDLEPLAFLLGTWRGEGTGEYPTIRSFGYGIETTFGHTGKPFLTYGHRTRSTEDGRALHTESGYWRVLPPDPATDAVARLEVVIAQPTGIAEVLLGQAMADGDGVRVSLSCDHLLLSPTAKDVRSLAWHLHWDGGDEIHERQAMAAVGRPLTHHLSATLRRT